MFVNLQTLEVISRDQLQALFPLTSFPYEIDNETLLEFGFAVLEYDERPAVAALDSYIAGLVRIENGRAIQGWEVVHHVPTPEEITATFERSIQGQLNAAAVAAGYDDISTAVSYAEEPAVPKFQNDGKAFRAWRSLVWAYAYAQLASVKAGDREQPTVEGFLQELPALVLPT